MIHDSRDYTVTLNAIEDLKAILKGLGCSPAANIVEINHLRQQVVDLQAEIKEYEHHTDRQASEHFNEEPLDEP